MFLSTLLNLEKTQSNFGTSLKGVQAPHETIHSHSKDHGPYFENQWLTDTVHYLAYQPNVFCNFFMAYFLYLMTSGTVMSKKRRPAESGLTYNKSGFIFRVGLDDISQFVVKVDIKLKLGAVCWPWISENHFSQCHWTVALIHTKNKIMCYKDHIWKMSCKICLKYKQLYYVYCIKK